MFIGGAIIYSLAQQFKNTTVSFVGAMLILVGYSIAGELTSDIDNEKIAALVDTFGIGTYNITSKYYTPLEKNTLNPSLSGLLLYNRIIWIGLASLILLASYSRFTFSTKKTKKNKIKAWLIDYNIDNTPLKQERHEGSLLRPCNCI